MNGVSVFDNFCSDSTKLSFEIGLVTGTRLTDAPLRHCNRESFVS